MYFKFVRSHKFRNIISGRDFSFKNVNKRPRPEVIFSFMYTILLPDDGQSNRPKHGADI